MISRVKQSSLGARVDIGEDGEKLAKGSFRKPMNGSVGFLLSPASCGGGGMSAVTSGTLHSCDNIQP